MYIDKIHLSHVVIGGHTDGLGHNTATRPRAAASPAKSIDLSGVAQRSRPSLQLRQHQNTGRREISGMRDSPAVAGGRFFNHGDRQCNRKICSS
jgi:hypothetical protein